MNEITPVPPPLAYGDIERLADAIAKSNLFGIKTKEQAIVLMAIAQAEGRHPVEAARDYDIVNNRPAKKAEAMLRDFIQAGGKVQWHSLTDELADATFTHPQTGEVRIDWDMKRAQTAFGKKEMYAKFPRQMLRSRVVSEGVRTLWPLATSGMYVPEEQADIPPEHNGPTLEAKAEREAINAEVPLTTKQQRLRGVDATGKPWRSAEGEDADRAEAAERERAAAAPMQRAARVAEKAAVYEAQPDGPQPERKTWRQLADAMEIAERDSMTPQELGLLIAKAENQEILRLAREGPYSDGKARIIAAYERAETRYLADPPDPPDPPAADLPEVEITGADKVQAG